MRKLLAVLGVAGLSALAVGASAYAAPQSTEDSNNQVNCGAPTADAGAAQVNAGGDPASGGFIEVCNDGSDGALQGSIYAEGSASGGGSVAADGDADNPEEGQGWVRVSGDGVTCGGETDTDSRDGGGSLENCG